MNLHQGHLTGKETLMDWHNVLYPARSSDSDDLTSGFDADLRLEAELRELLR